MNSRRLSMDNRSSASTANSFTGSPSPSTSTNDASNLVETSNQTSLTTAMNIQQITPSLTTVQEIPVERSSSLGSLNTRSDVWKYFERSSNIVPLKAKCLLCGDQLLTPNYATSSLKRHLSQRHSLAQFGPVKSNRLSVAAANMPKPIKTKLDMTALDAIIQDGRTFGDLQKPGIRKFIEVLRPGYKPPHRNTITKRLKRLHHQHSMKTKNEFQEADFLSITCDFWTNRHQNSFLVVTGHYVDKSFNQHAKVLKFMTFEDRHTSESIAQVIEKELMELDLYDKLVTITCDGASNMKQMFNYFTRKNIKYINCFAHRLHLVICNSLHVWVPPKKNATIAEDDDDMDTNDNEQDEAGSKLSQMVRTISFDEPTSSNGQNESDQDVSQDEDENDPQAMDDGNLVMSNDEEWIDDDDDGEEEEEEELNDNFIHGVNTKEESLNTDEQKTNDAIVICRKVVNMIKKSSIITSFIEKKRAKFNTTVSRAQKVKRKLVMDVRTRWNSTFLMLNTFNLYRDFLMDMFKSKTMIHLTGAQRKKLTNLEITSDMWDIINCIITVLRPFYSATKVLSTIKYPTMGSTLYIVRTLEHYLEAQGSDRFLNHLKVKLLKVLREYIYNDQDQWNTLKFHSYFDPIGFTSLTRTEQLSVEKEIQRLFKKQFESNLSNTSSSASNMTNEKASTAKIMHKAWAGFLQSTNTDVAKENLGTRSIQDDLKRYRDLATKFHVDHQFTDALTFWKQHGLKLPLLSSMARCYLSSPATSVPSESAFSISAYYGRKERARLSPDNLALSVYLKDKLNVSSTNIDQN